MKKQKNLSQSSRDKIEKMYQAVIFLLDKGKDINSIKVADITERAGIGKGTAYEYFESKEEIIANAMKYNMKKQADSLYRLNEETESFRERVMQTMDWIENNLKYKKSYLSRIKIGNDYTYLEHNEELTSDEIKQYNNYVLNLLSKK